MCDYRILPRSVAASLVSQGSGVYTASPNIKYLRRLRWDCIGAIDGTHVQVEVQKDKHQSYRNRKRFTSQNILYEYDFDILFTFIAVGWEYVAHEHVGIPFEDVMIFCESHAHLSQDE
ncbi:hypothetical protein CQW23_00792 [Capsicum baccatum]|uniref:DDE Tnp4 domain-containing protein n=1 Tax=Capsicum baccatum TaxID=33114 RepID=A0A2G2XLT7_CAPBA|nr:hypothetical protein CQW23_00792 [Capsicum baccatum]